MRTASRQRSPGRLVAFFSGPAALVFAHACLIEIEEPLDGPDASTGGSVSAGGSAGNGATGGSTGGTSGASGASGGDAGAASSCGDGGKRCGTDCVRTNDPEFGCNAPTCDPCFRNAEATCGTSGACGVFTGCKPGFFDCNDDRADGCEVSLVSAPTGFMSSQWDGGTGPDGGPPPRPAYKVPRLTTAPVIDGNPRDWPAQAPLVRLVTPCTGCQSIPAGQPGGDPGVPVLFPDEVPGAIDLEAYFRIGWAPGSLFVLALVKDNERVAATTSAPAAETQDGIELFLDASAGFNEGFDPDDGHLFIGASSGLRERNASRQDPSAHVQIERRTEGSCYFVELKVSSTYLDSTAEASPPDVGVIYGFDIAVNDWDTESGMPNRAHQVLWQPVGVKYAFDTSGFPAIELTP